MTGRPFSEQLKRAKRRLLRMHYESHIGHIGGNLSALDAVLLLHVDIMTADDTFVLSKGHAAGALYVALWATGKLSDAELEQFHGDASRLSGHPAGGWHPDIPFGTGSLGHGPGLASGLALGKRLRGERGTVYCLVSDGECQEGSTWETALFCGHHRLTNLVVLVDANGLQGFGTTQEIASLEPIPDKLRGFGLQVDEIPGHDPAALHTALSGERTRPQWIVLRTHKGHGISFMEDRLEWHYLPLDAAQYELALQEIDAT
jgi:transketolase